MATTQGSGAVNNQGAMVYTWNGVTPGNPGNAVDTTAFSGRASIQIEGTLGTGPAYNIEGSNDGTNFETLKDASGTSLGSLAAKGIFTLQPNVRYVRPNVTAGTGGTSLNFTLVLFP